MEDLLAPLFASASTRRPRLAGRMNACLRPSMPGDVTSTCLGLSIAAAWAMSSAWSWNTSKAKRSGPWWGVWVRRPIMLVSCLAPFVMQLRSTHAGFASAGEMAAPVIHRDLKPSNIIVSGANYTPDTGMTFSSLVIIDLGIARVWREGADADTVKFGTRPYAPPEQYGFGQTSVRSDVYALGALLFFCLTGADPKPGRNIREQCEARDVPASLADVICMAMALDPDKRFASAKALGHAARASYASSAPNAASFQEPPEWRAVCPAPVLPTDQSQGGLPLVPERPSLLSRIPDTVGRIWNAFVYLSLLVFFAGSHVAVFHPTGANQNYPMWFLAIEYFIFVDGLVVLIHFVMLDKRRLRRRFELLDRYRGKKLAKLWLKAMGVLLLAMIIIVAIANATGVIDTSVA